MKVLFLATNPAKTEAGTRYRLEQFFGHMRAAGQVPTIRTFFDQRQPSVRRTTRGLARRTLDVITAGRYDVAFIYRELMPYSLNFTLPLFSSRLPLAFDFDDSIFLPSTTGLGRAIAQPESTCRLVAAADLVYAGNEYLAEYARKYSRVVEVLPTVVDTEVYRPLVREPPAVPLVGWVGSPTTAPYLDAVLPIIDDLAKDLRFRLRIVGAGRTITLKNVQVESPPWHALNEEALFQDIDVGIYPLVDDAWARGKCGFKAIQYMACGIASVVSPVGVVRDIVRDRVDGFWATTPAIWRESLAMLITDSGARVQLGAAGRERIRSHYSLGVVGPRFVAGLERIAGSRADATLHHRP